MVVLDAIRNPSYFVVLVATLVVALTFHEFAHAWTAARLGDDTARLAGRLTLDPRRHLDVMGSLVFLIVGFGWARPVPVDGYTLGHRGMLWVALAGPVSNLILATLVLVPLGLVYDSAADLPIWAFALAFFGFLNLGLAVFNLIPVAPLDGWKVLLGSVPRETAWRLTRYEMYGPMALLLLLVLPSFGGPDVLGTVIVAFRDLLFGLLAGFHLFPG